MTAGGARRGRRDNGLDAADYAVAGDVDPRVGEHLLDVLAAGGIAAYLQPTADLNPILRATTLPARPIDRLYVDRTHLDAAREHLHKVTGGEPPTPAAPPPADPTAEPSSGVDIEAEWAKIVAGFHTTVDPTAAPWPASEAIERPKEPPRTGGLSNASDFSGVSLNRRRTDPPAEDPSLLDGLDTFGAGLPGDEDEEERYVPPPPPPLPRISKYAVIGVLGVVVGFLLFLFPTLIPIDRDYVTMLGFAAIVGGAVMLVWRLRSGDDEDDFDDGAVV
ncbi:hypothetical protein Aab01nite_39960 [Paractinoplanes abujensis]|uniref:DUF308 domain-containing protein n=1 Tax=Paractinoplanes abujensis TaxID=882441 RepID=A0A7W7CTE6_9ACTN|nr:DUF308 domain-containing protein [Actinoplanes abujensis]MBB4694380.1 hypothetical protein [Actinoplanes abujensis]GID20406.1 hypothetical protein Aab01nite_39960 [Actinoplanes abujensis]